MTKENTEQITAEQLFLRYASPCLDYGLQEGRISHDDYIALEHCAVNGFEPSRVLLEKCFPDAVESVAAYAKTTGVPTWSMEAVAGYWRGHHLGESPVFHGTVVYIYGDPKRSKNSPVYKAEVSMHSTDAAVEEAHVLMSLHGLDLHPGDGVTVHMGLIIEKLPQ